MNNNSIKTITELVTPFLPNNEKSIIKAATVKHSYKGPLCDDQGYSQHKGECWNDTLQEVFLFSDGLKDITQPLIYNLDTSKDYLFTLISSKLFPNITTLDDKQLNTVNKLVKYITLMKVRFVNHYNHLVDIETYANNNDTLIELYKPKRRLSKICGIGSAKHIINLYYGNSNIYKPGLRHTLKNELVQNLFIIFDIPYITTSLKPSDKLSNISAVFISCNLMILSDTNTYSYKGSHALGFLKCNSIWKYYDDNEARGLIDINEDIVSTYINNNNTNVAIAVDKNKSVYILLYKLDNSVNFESSIATITQYYEGGKWNDWNSEWDEIHKFRKINTKNIISIIRLRIRWANIKRRTAKGGNKKYKTIKRNK